MNYSDKKIYLCRVGLMIEHKREREVLYEEYSNKKLFLTSER
jgi:hypothetical protein